MGTVVQKLSSQNVKTYIGPGKVQDIMAVVNATKTTVLVIDDDLTTKQQRNLEDMFAANGAQDIKILDRTAIILEIFAQHAKSREGQLQVELAMLEYRLTRGPSSSGDVGRDSGAGFRGPGESKLETDKRLIRDKIILVKTALVGLKQQRENHRESRRRLGLPVIALVGYTNAGKSTLLNRLSRAGVLAENMLFATLDPTTRKVVLPKAAKALDLMEAGRHNKGQEVLLTDTVGFISKLPTDLIAAFRATLGHILPYSHAFVSSCYHDS
jgi:GTP-binding protein HflX